MSTTVSRDNHHPSYRRSTWLIITYSLLPHKVKKTTHQQSFMNKLGTEPYQTSDRRLRSYLRYCTQRAVVCRGSWGRVASRLDASKFIRLKLTLDFFGLCSTYFQSFWIWFSLFHRTKPFHCSRAGGTQWWIRPFLWLQGLTIRPAANYLLRAWQQALCSIASVWSIML